MKEHFDTKGFVKVHRSLCIFFGKPVVFLNNYIIMVLLL